MTALVTSYMLFIMFQAPTSMTLKLGCNSTRPAPWYNRLGYQSDPRPLCVPLTGLAPEGGVVGALDVVIVRKYPVMVGTCKWLLLYTVGGHLCILQSLPL